MNKEILQIPATIEKITTLSDRSLSIKILTQELSEEDNASVFRYFQKIGWFVFSESPIKQEDLNLPEIKGDNTKTPSQRLRNVIFRIQEKELERKPTEKEFRDYYEDFMARIINHCKEKLD